MLPEVSRFIMVMVLSIMEQVVRQVVATLFWELMLLLVWISFLHFVAIIASFSAYTKLGIL